MSVAPPAGDTKQLAIREARRRLQQKIRNDWEFACDESCPTLNAYASQSTAVAPSQSPDADTKLPTFDEWRQRTYASSDPSSDEEDAKKDSMLRRKRDLLFKSPQPDEASSGGRRSESSSDADLRRREARKKRRRHKLEQEMTWNEGLRFWQARRNAWCGAKRVTDQAAEDTDEQQDSGHGSVEAPSEEDSVELKRSASATTLVPVAPALIVPGDPTHINITPALYPSIYSKVVLQSLTPSVPINLRHLISALVEGWKRDGEWPPKGSGLAAAAAATAPRAQAKPGASAHNESHTSRLGLGGVRKGMARMRRSLRLSLSGGSGTGTGTNTGDEKTAAAAGA